MNIILGKSLKGHDKNHIYVVYEETDGYVYLVNGTTKKINNPKRKNLLHVQLIRNLSEEIRSKADNISSLNDDNIRDIVTMYNEYLCKSMRSKGVRNVES